MHRQPFASLINCGLVLVACILTTLAGQCRADIVYGAEYGADTLFRIDAQGNRTTFGATSNLSGPTGMALDSAGNIFVASSNTGAVRKFSSSLDDLGDFITAPDFDISGLACDALGNVYVGCFSGPTFVQDGSIRRYAPNGDYLGIFTTLTIDNLPIEFGPASYFSMEFDGQGNLWAVDDFFGKLYKFAPNGDNLLTINARGAFASAIAPNGDVFVSDSFEVAPGILSNGLHRFSSAGDDLGYVATDTPFMIGMSFDSDGHIVASLPDFGEVRRFSVTGQDLGALVTGLSFPTGVAVGISAVPEPTSMALCGLVLTACAARRRFKRPTMSND